MKKSIRSIKPFFSSVSYLLLEARRLGLHEVTAICENAVERLLKYMIDELLEQDGKREKIKISKQEYKYISDVLIGISTMPQQDLERFIEILKRQMDLIENADNEPLLYKKAKNIH